jgi:shikimate dehydrogenase
MADAPVRAFVCGHPVAHSRSPLIHGHWLRELGLAGSYERIDVAPADFAAFVRALPVGPHAGGNVTIPHKEAAFALADRRDAAAQAIGAVNTLWLEAGSVVGGNTDAYGFAASLDAGAPGWRDAGVATVLGAGGAARAVVHALAEAGIGDIRIVNRSRERAEAVAALAPGRAGIHGWAESAALLAGTDLLVNTTPLGMAGQAQMDVDPALLPDSAIVADIVYVPLVTPLLRQAQARGLRTVDGLGMLLHQAVAGFERWFGVRPQVTPALRAGIVADLEDGQ